MPFFTSSIRVATVISLMLPMAFISGRAVAQRADSGVQASVNGLVRLLEEGWGADGYRASLPGDLAGDNSDLLSEAWKALALRRDEVRSDSPLAARVSALSLRYATGNPPAQILEMIEEDLYRTPLDELEDDRARRLDYLRHNGMIALGIFGLPTDDLVEKAVAVYEAEQRPIVRVSYARSLALLEWPQAFNELVSLAASEDRAVAVAAAQSLFFLTGRVIRLHAQMAVEPRREAAESIRRWWDSVAENPPTITREMVLQRQAYGVRDTRPAPSSRLHADLRASAMVADAADRYGSRTAWRRLEDQGPALATQLEPILANAREDLDVRAEAVRWYVKLRGEDAAKVLKRLRKDPNPEIVELAKQMLDGLK